MNREAFFAALRARNSGVFGTRLTQGQVQGIEALLDACEAQNVRNPHHVANVMAQVYRETGGRMMPVRETFADSDAQAVARLDRAFAAGKLPWVKAPYWRPDADGKAWFGRGQIQLTHKANYAKFGFADPAEAMDLAASARVAVVGMRDGKFKGRKLADYTWPADLHAPPALNPRRIVNGRDGTDAEVAGYHRAFHAALTAGGFGAEPRPVAQPPAAPPPPRPAPLGEASAPEAPAPRTGLLAAILALLARIFGGTK